MNRTKTPKTLTASELIDYLQDVDPDMSVVFASNYGDRSQTQQVHFLSGRFDERTLKESAYSDSGWALMRDDVEDVDDDDVKTVLVLS